MIKPTILYFGTPAFSTTVLTALDQANYAICGVVTGPDKPQGRSHVLSPSPVRQWALNHNIASFSPQTFRNNEPIVEKLRKLSPDVLIVYSYGKIIPDDILAIAKHGAINVHPSLLPKYRGPSPVQSQILQGETVTGVTLIEMTNEVDAGPIIAKQSVAMPQDATFKTLIGQLSDIGAKLLIEVLPKYLAHNIKAQQQAESKTPYTEKVTRETGFVPIEQLAKIDQVRFARMVRAYYPWPGVWTKFENKVVKFLPGGSVQLEGKTPVAVQQFLSGYPRLKPVLAHLYGLN